ncbi:MAG: hypothetical protein ACKER6_01320, partial [Candidatus Hodgkinia cicadicola]
MGPHFHGGAPKPKLNVLALSEKLRASYHASQNPNKVALFIVPRTSRLESLRLTEATVQYLVASGFNTLCLDAENINQYGEVVPSSKIRSINAQLMLEWLLRHHSHQCCACVVGFSLGCCVAAEVATRRPEVTRYLLISPPLKYYDFIPLSKLKTKGIAIFGSEDKLSAKTNISHFFGNICRRSPRPNMRLGLVRGSDHYFNNNVDNFLSVLSAVVADLEGSTERTTPQA